MKCFLQLTEAELMLKVHIAPPSYLKDLAWSPDCIIQLENKKDSKSVRVN